MVASVIKAKSYNLAVTIDRAGTGKRGTGDINGGKHPPVIYKPVATSAIRVCSYNLSVRIDTQGASKIGAWDIDRGEHAIVIQISVKRPTAIFVGPYNPPARIDFDSVGVSLDDAGDIDLGAPVIEESVRWRANAIKVNGYNLSAMIDPKRVGKRGTGEIDRGEQAVTIYKAMAAASAAINVVPYNLTP